METENLPKSQYISIKLVNGIIHINFNDSTEVDINVAKEIFAYSTNTIKLENRLLLVDVRNLKLVTQEARRYFAEEDPKQTVKAIAFYSENILHKIIYSFFKHANNPPYPARFFKSYEEAVHWLNQYKKAFTI
ncbi:hypothetical protein RCC89_07740 [Cytophagaceae bacterium ABcell3]|nr:hypothetical protein RCC89_07740 [Cytophagaceae bacterium ABcell3]